MRPTVPKLRYLVVALLACAVPVSVSSWLLRSRLNVVQQVRHPRSEAAQVPQDLDEDGRDKSGRIYVARGSVLVVGSTDLSAQHHSVAFEWSPVSAHSLASTEILNSRNHPFDVHRPLATPTRFADAASPAYRRIALPPLECTDAVTARRFAVPFFPQSGNAMERFVIADLVAAGGKTRVFVASDQSVSRRHLEKAHEIVATIEVGLREFVESHLVPIADVDGDGHLSIVMCNLAGTSKATRSEEPIRGCVREKDFLNASWQFRGDVIYLDLDLPSGDQLAAVLAHELAHAATFSGQMHRDRDHVRTDHSFVRLPFWINEGIAHYLENAVCPASENLAKRLRKYQARRFAYPLVMPDDYPNRAVRRGPARAAALSFMQFAVGQHPQLLTHLIVSPFGGVLSLERATGQSFSEMFRRWTMSQAVSSASISLTDRRLNRLTIAGTAFVSFLPAESSGFVTIRAMKDAGLQITILPPAPSADRIAIEVDSRGTKL